MKRKAFLRAAVLFGGLSLCSCAPALKPGTIGPSGQVVPPEPSYCYGEECLYPAMLGMLSIPGAHLSPPDPRCKDLSGGPGTDCVWVPGRSLEDRAHYLSPPESRGGKVVP